MVKREGEGSAERAQWWRMKASRGAETEMELRRGKKRKEVEITDEEFTEKQEEKSEELPEDKSSSRQPEDRSM